jgi:plasmid maintenance system antidote protein VapI
MKHKRKNALGFFKPAKSAGALVKAFRKSFDISQSQFAAAVGITQSNLSAIENESREVGKDVALKLSAVMGLSPEIILFPGGYEEEADYRAARERSNVIIPMMAAKK